MDEYISKHEVIDYLNGYLDSLGGGGAEALMFERGQRRALINAIHNISAIKAADVQPVPQWISVKDRLPEAVEEDVNGKTAFSDFVLVYLVCNDGFTYITNDKCRVNDKSWLHEIPGEGCKVTHWMPLPEPPKDGDAE